MPVHPPSTAIIIGAGIVGAATAFFLTRRGVTVTLLDAKAPAAEASGAADGAVSVASKRPGVMMNAALKGVELYRQLARDGLFSDLFRDRSTFIIAASDVECAVLEAHRSALSGAGVATEHLDRGALHRRYPVLSDRAEMAIEVMNDGHAIGYQIVNRLIAAAGIAVMRNASVMKLVANRAGTRIMGVETANGLLTADLVIVAAGTGSAKLAGLDHVLTPRKGQLLITERVAALNASMPGSIMSGRYLLSKGSQKGASGEPARGLGLVIDPLRTGQFLIGGTREDFGDKQITDIDAVAHILADAVALVPRLATARLLRTFAGARTAVSDGLPIIGRLPDFENAYIATGFEGDGICLGPVTGKSVAELCCGETPTLDLSPFSPGRFAMRERAA
ncbi:FAD-binding oxidoreductase [Martelella sp. HB161492]|uniref:NAD(P)/FAD-dependent oxidoreductase n=1 Tax=Martelella sp. HB161492 TaxID=2720726 RepID=UPI001591ED7A|nr:FAD-binding oxidoreductase [Martelella sp. HB161492]